MFLYFRKNYSGGALIDGLFVFLLVYLLLWSRHVLMCLFITIQSSNFILLLMDVSFLLVWKFKSFLVSEYFDSMSFPSPSHFFV